MFNKDELAYLLHAVDSLPSAGNIMAARNKAAMLQKISDLLEEKPKDEE